MYFLSDCIYFFVYYAFGYRKDVVFANLKIAFPEKTDKERERIAKDFYHGFVDSFVETVKLISISKEELNIRMIGNYEVLNELKGKKQKVQLHAGHFFNWEFMNLAASANSAFPFVGVYAPLKNEVLHKIIRKLRSQFGTILIPGPEFRTTFHQYADKEYALGLVADQSASNPDTAFWYPFFGKLAPFVTGPEKGAKRNDTAIVMVDFHKVKRGYYEAELTLLTTDPKSFEAGRITKELIQFIEAAVRKRPSNYLWTHRRWKREFIEEKHRKLVIE
jgi:KDO2-lipid IV(A) lauroyltransferase